MVASGLGFAAIQAFLELVITIRRPSDRLAPTGVKSNKKRRLSMATEESLHEAARLRFRFQMNNRLRLESLAAISRVFRDFGEPIEDELLASIVFAVPEELIGE